MLKSTRKFKRLNKNPKAIYLDYASSFAPNPSSIHVFGVEAKVELEKARSKVAETLGSRNEEVIFTSGGTEGNNIAIQGTIFAWIGQGLPHIVTTNIEHPSVLETFKILEARRLAEISIVPVEQNGIVDPKKIKKELKENTVLVSVMYANNEIGTIQPIKEITKEIRHYKKTKKVTLPFFHTDAVQAINYLDLNVNKLGVDLLTLSGAKIKNAGVGALYVRKGMKLFPIYSGGDQEFGLRPGTPNVPEITKFANVLFEVEKNKAKESKRLEKLRDYFAKKLNKLESLVLINGDLRNRLPNNLNITLPKIPSDLLVIELSARGIMTSSKSACKSSQSEGSYVIKAINPNLDKEIGGLRFSFGADTTKKDIDYTFSVLVKILEKLKKWYY